MRVRLRLWSGGVPPRAVGDVHDVVEAARMNGQEQDVLAARRAARDLVAAVDRLARFYPNSVDHRRLAEDTARIATDLDLLVGPPRQAAPVQLEVIADSEYPSHLFEGAEDEGLGPRRR